MENILNLSIEEMQIALKEGKIKPSDLVKASIEKAKENPQFVKNLLCSIGNACLMPAWVTNIPHAAEQLLSSPATTRESVCCNGRSHMMQ